MSPTPKQEISELTRRGIFDYLSASGKSWSGRLEDDDFLARLYDLTALPSNDPRMANAAGDIYQHRVNWRDDWPDDWVFYDKRFELLRSADDAFLRFLCETVHPVVRSSTEEVQELVDAYNAHLAADGWALVRVQTLSGRPVYGGRKVGARVQVFEEPTGWQKVDRQLQEVRLRLGEADSEEEFQAVGLLCREALISAAQATFDPEHHPVEGDVRPSDTDAARMLGSVVAAELRGAVNEEARAHAKAALKLALALQHKRTADFRMAALCAEATSSVINMLAVLMGRRGRSM